MAIWGSGYRLFNCCKISLEKFTFFHVQFLYKPNYVRAAHAICINSYAIPNSLLLLLKTMKFYFLNGLKFIISIKS